RIAQLASQPFIGLARSWIAGRMVMEDDDRRGAELQRTPHDLARVDCRAVDRSAEQHLGRNERVARRQERRTEALVVAAGDEVARDQHASLDGRDRLAAMLFDQIRSGGFQYLVTRRRAITATVLYSQRAHRSASRSS